jgi:hypothetical protein
MRPKPHLLPIIVIALAAIVPNACASNTGASSGGSAPVDAAVAILPADSDTIPCEPRAVLMTVCQRCHTRPPRRGAPFSLVNRSDIVRIGPSGQIRVLMIEQLEARRMPLSPETIDDDSRAVLLDWLRAGAPAVPPTSCLDGGLDDGGLDALGGDGLADAGEPTDADPDVCTKDAEADQ